MRVPWRAEAGGSQGSASAAGGAAGEGEAPGGDGGERRPNAFVRLYRGETSFDFVGRRKLWLLASGVVIVAGIVSLSTRGLNMGIDFRGGTSWQVPANGASVNQARAILGKLGLGGATAVSLGTGSSRHLEVEADLLSETAAKRSATEAAVSSALAKLTHEPVGNVDLKDVGPTWGGQVTSKAELALIVFFVAIAAYITFRFEWKMAGAALIAVVHDILVTVGIYSLAGFQVTPDTVVAFLTILGYSLYDTIVVFDRVQENAKGLGASGRMTYSSTVNLAMNQVMARSMNTSLVAILPVASVLFIGAYVLGATTLQYFGLALFIGLMTGAYSSIFIASPLLAGFKEREPRYLSIRQKLQARGEAIIALTPAAAAAGGALAGSDGGTRRFTDARRSQRRAATRVAEAAGRRGSPGGVLRPSAASQPPAGAVRPENGAGGVEPMVPSGTGSMAPGRSRAGGGTRPAAQRTSGRAGGSGQARARAGGGPPRSRKKRRKR